MAQEQVEVEFRNELQQLQQMQMMMQQNPQMAQQLQMQARMMSEKIESRKAVLIAEMMEEKEITSQFDNDPIAKLRARELDLRAMENERKKKESEDRLNLDKMKSMMNQVTDQQKLEQNEELANLRSDTSITKTVLQHELKNRGGI
jgi:hypothetical protein